VITSHHNPLLKDVRRIAARKDRGRFVAEGEDLLAAAAAAGWAPVHLLRAGVEVEAEALAKVSTLGSGTRALGVFEERWAAPTGPLCVCLWGVRDPGNVGTVLRGALAFGASCVALGPGTADPYGPKAVRASMGAVFAVPLARVTQVAELPGEAVGLAARTGVPLAALEGTGARSVVVGAEREGLPEDVAAACDALAHIPIASESLNAAMAATIALYELTSRVADR
jgi:TrmH family RNA methyltransferase